MADRLLGNSAGAIGWPVEQLRSSLVFPVQFRVECLSGRSFLVTNSAPPGVSGRGSPKTGGHLGLR